MPTKQNSDNIQTLKGLYFVIILLALQKIYMPAIVAYISSEEVPFRSTIVVVRALHILSNPFVKMVKMVIHHKKSIFGFVFRWQKYIPPASNVFRKAILTSLGSIIS